MDDSGDRAPRIQLVAALLLLLVLVVVPLYLWRRPRTVEPDPNGTATTATLTTPVVVGGDAGASTDGGEAAVTLGELRMVECHDPGSKRTAPADCDRLPAFEHAVTDAIRAEASCGTGAGEVLWVVDVSTLRKKSPVLVTVTKDGHALKSGKVATDCTSALKKALATVVVDKTHAHARYKMEVTATYR